MSFSGDVKAELCRQYPTKRCCAMAECFGILLFCNTFSDEQIKIITESENLAKVLPKLFRKAFGFDFDELPDPTGSTKRQFVIHQPKKLAKILDTYGFSRESTVSLHVNLGVLEEDCCRSSFLRGAFLAGGSVTDPEKDYHLELMTTHRAVGREAKALAGEVMGFYPKLTQRGGNSVLYLKQSDQISDFLTRLGAPVCAMGIIEARLEKEIKNNVNRCCNCDDANTSKVVDAAQRHLSAIRSLQQAGKFDALNEKLRTAAIARLEHPEANLTELGALMQPPITKSAMNNRLNRLLTLAKESEEE